MFLLFWFPVHLIVVVIMTNINDVIMQCTLFSPYRSVGKRLLSSFDVMVGTAGCLGKAEREAVLRRELKEEDEKDGDSSLSVWVADETEGFTGADLVALVAEAR